MSLRCCLCICLIRGVEGLGRFECCSVSVRSTCPCQSLCVSIYGRMGNYRNSPGCCLGVCAAASVCRLFRCAAASSFLECFEYLVLADIPSVLKRCHGCQGLLAIRSRIAQHSGLDTLWSRNQLEDSEYTQGFKRSRHTHYSHTEFPGIGAQHRKC